jgi:hypothetical protein
MQNSRTAVIMNLTPSWVTVSTTAFLSGAQVDAIIRAQSMGTPSRIEPDSRTSQV